MVDQYYSTTLPQLLQELDDVYHDVSAVVAETIINGADVISVKVRKNISKMDINPNAFLHKNEYNMNSRTSFTLIFFNYL